jgi:uncharacterized protein YebE (UPF0316 family)
MGNSKQALSVIINNLGDIEEVLFISFGIVIGISVNFEVLWCDEASTIIVCRL